jgi:hypothetical protein
VKITFNRLRDVILLGLGTSGMINQEFITHQPNVILIGASLLCIAGTAVLNAWVLATAHVPVPPSHALPTTTPSGASEQSSSPSH